MRVRYAILVVCGAVGCSPDSAARAEPGSTSPSRALEQGGKEAVGTGGAAPARPSYRDVVQAIERRRVDSAEKCANPSECDLGMVEQEIIGAVRELSSYWLGTRWGLGAPQTSAPQDGKINCGTFVGTVLRDAGFNLQVKKLQRQPSQLIIASFVSGDRVRKYSDADMDDFLKSVAEMGPGLFIIGLDFHVGFLIQQTDSQLRFVHASYETETVVDEPAATAMPITSSRYRVVGKLLSRRNLEDWLGGKRIEVKGKW